MTVPATFEDGVIPGVGTFTALQTELYIRSEPNFTGVAPAVTIQRVDRNCESKLCCNSYTSSVEPAKPVEPR